MKKFVTHIIQRKAQ